MTRDHLIRAILPEYDLRVLIAHATSLSQHAASIHGCESTAAAVLGHTLVGTALVAGLGKGKQRVTVQLEGKGPMRGLFVDGSADGMLRGYVREGRVSFPGRDPSDLSFSLGPEGYLSVLRELPGGEFYRAAVGLDFPRLDRNLEHYFEVSEQVDTTLAVEAPLGEAGFPYRAVGVLVQRLPDGDPKALEAIRARLRSGALARAIEEHEGGGVQIALPLLEGFGELELLEDVPLAYRCECTRERAERGVAAAGRDEILDMIARDKGAELSCEFCKTIYKFDAEELMRILDDTEFSPT